MKNLILAFILFPLVLSAQSDHFSQKNALKISPAEFGNAQFEISYERYFKERSSSIQIAPSIFLKEDINSSKEGYQLSGQYRVYLSHIKSEDKSVFLGFHNIGLYAGVYGLYFDYKEDYQFQWWDNSNNEQLNVECTKDVTSLEGGAILGVQFDITKKILIDFFVGGGVRYSDYTDTKYDYIEKADYYDSIGVFDPEYKGVKPKLGLQIGFLF